jgi:hypothetical protein
MASMSGSGATRIASNTKPIASLPEQMTGALVGPDSLRGCLARFDGAHYCTWVNWRYQKVYIYRGPWWAWRPAMQVRGRLLLGVAEGGFSRMPKLSEAGRSPFSTEIYRCSRLVPAWRPSAALRQLIRHPSSKGLLKKPTAPASSTRLRRFSSGNAVMKMIGVSTP